jgi:dihydrodipicolinate synthase/N-acetylneuraminate lyase
MAFRELAQPLKGIIPPLATPLSAPDELDEAAVEQLVEHVVAGGVHGLFLLGTCGEGPSLSYRLRRQLVERVCRQVDSRIPVLVSITDTSLAETLAAAQHATDAGADTLVLAPPYYYPIEQSDLVAYVLRVVGEVPLPLVLYNMPSLTKLAFDAESVRRLMQEEAIVGLKDSSGDLKYFQSIRQLSSTRPDWTLLMGPEHLLSRSLELGGDGGVSGGANVCPQMFVQIYEAAFANCDTAIAEQKGVFSHLVDQADRLGRIYRIGPPTASSVIKGLKSALSVLGICENVVAEPLKPHTPQERDQVAEILRSLGIESAAVAR